jgi:hypothetical protein
MTRRERVRSIISRYSLLSGAVVNIAVRVIKSHTTFFGAKTTRDLLLDLAHAQLHGFAAYQSHILAPTETAGCCPCIFSFG